jgi:hypothetical protein
MGVTRRARVWAVFALAALSLAGGAGGCRGRAAGVPEAARFEKAGKRVSYTAPHDGTVYVVDDWFNRLVYKGPVHRGDHVVVVPGAGTLTVAGKDVAGGRKLTDADHSIYVEAEGGDAR